MAFLNRYPEGAIIDEIQRAPLLLSEIQVRVDESGRKGVYILTGSQQIDVHAALAQSLAGRTALVKLLPLSLKELRENGIGGEPDELLLSGGFPRIYLDRLNPYTAYNDYIETYVERDVRRIIAIKELRAFRKFLHLCAGRIGQMLNKEGLANEVGVSAKTIGQWIAVLEASYIIFLLQPYFENFGKRAVKAPKLYFCDVGLASTLLGIETTTQVSRDPLRGNLFENMVVLELIKARYNLRLPPNAYYYRDSQQREVDLIFKRGHELIPIEIKSATTYNSSFFAGLETFRKIAKTQCAPGYVIYAGDIEQNIGDNRLLNFRRTAEIVAAQET